MTQSYRIMWWPSTFYTFDNTCVMKYVGNLPPTENVLIFNIRFFSRKLLWGIIIFWIGHWVHLNRNTLSILKKNAGRKTEKSKSDHTYIVKTYFFFYNKWTRIIYVNISPHVLIVQYIKMSVFTFQFQYSWLLSTQCFGNFMLFLNKICILGNFTRSSVDIL